MAKNTSKVFELSPGQGLLNVALPDTTSLDAITRQLPQGYYTTFRTLAGRTRVIGLRTHLARLYVPAEKQGIPIALDESGLRDALRALLSTLDGEVRVRITMSMDGRLFLAAEPLKLLPDSVYEHGVRVITCAAHRDLPRLKRTAFIEDSEDVRTQLKKAGAFEALMVRRECILEGLTSNFFYIREGLLGTARRDILLGVTRRTVLRVGRGIGLDVVYQSLRSNEIPAIGEAFLTSSSRGIVPIVQIDETQVGEGTPGRVTRKLMAAYQDYIIRNSERI